MKKLTYLFLFALFFLCLSSCDSSKNQDEVENEEATAIAEEEEATAIAEEEEAAAEAAALEEEKKKYEGYDLFQWNEISKNLEPVGTTADYTKSGWIFRKDYNTFDGDRYSGYTLNKNGDYMLSFEIVQYSPTGDTGILQLAFYLDCLERNQCVLNDASKFLFAVDENKRKVFEWQHVKVNPNCVALSFGYLHSERKKWLDSWGIAEMLKSGSKLEIRIESKAEKKTDLTFDLSGFSSVFNAVCREYLDNIDEQKVY